MQSQTVNRHRWLAILIALCPWFVGAQETSKVRIVAITDTGYLDEQQRYVVDLLEQDYAYLAVRIETEDGTPVEGVQPTISLDGKSQLVTPAELSEKPGTDSFGVIEFAVIGGPLGLDTVTVSLGDASIEMLVNVISLQSQGFPSLAVVEGGIPWADLMKAKVQYKETMIVAEFPADVEARAGKTVKLSGFMVPLEPELKQRRFLLTSNPPSCYFHIPGGPAGAVEVFATEGIEASWNPVVIEGRFDPLASSEEGVVYRLHDARLISP